MAFVSAQDGRRRGHSQVLLGPSALEERRRIAFQTLSPLYESIDNVSRSIVEYLGGVGPDLLPATVRVSYREFETKLNPNWKEFFVSADDLNDAMADGINRVKVGIHSGINRGGYRHCRIKDIRLDTTRERFIIDLTWVKDPSRLRKFFQRRH